MSDPIRIISSMATRQLLAALAERYRRTCSQPLSIESVGGVDAARRVRAGEAFDAVVLACDVIDRLIGEGHLVTGSRIDLVRSGVAVAICDGAPRPAIETEAQVRDAVLGARSVGYSTGPSGTELIKLFERWGIVGQLENRLVRAPPGVPVGALVAGGKVELGFQQASELVGLPGITVLGPLPAPIAIITVFSAGMAAASKQPRAVRALFEFMASDEVAQLKRDHGMEPA